MNIINPYIGPSSLVPVRPGHRPEASEQPVDAVHLQSPIDETAAVSEDEPKCGFATTAATTAVLVAGALSCLAGTVMPTITALSQPTMSTVAPNGTVQRKEAPAPITTPEQASGDVHVISNIDATESIIEPFATSNLGQLQRTSAHPGVTVDVAIERQADPGLKLITGGIVLGATAAPFIIARKLRKKVGNRAVLAIALTMAGAAGSYMVGSSLGLMHNGIGPIISAGADYQHEEGVWSGNREIHMADGKRQAVSSNGTAEVSPERITDFLANNMKKYPSGTTVVHLFGHGLMYRHVSGMNGDAFEKVIADATTRAGRPIDVLVLESCLQGNLETLSGVYPHARYAVVSEESIAAGSVGRMFEHTASALDGKAQTPRELSMQMLRLADGDHGVRTLAVVDLQQIPQLNEAVDRLGASLTAEVKDGHTTGIRAAVDATAVYPLDEQPTAKKLAIGDLKQFAKHVLEQYAHDGSPRGAQIRTEAQGVLDALGRTVIGMNTQPEYRDAGGLSIQLPGAKISSLEKKANVLGARGMSSYGAAASPEHWREFVTAMSDKMAPPQPTGQ